MSLLHLYLILVIFTNCKFVIFCDDDYDVLQFDWGILHPSGGSTAENKSPYRHGNNNNQRVDYLESDFGTFEDNDNHQESAVPTVITFSPIGSRRPKFLTKNYTKISSSSTFDRTPSKISTYIQKIPKFTQSESQIDDELIGDSTNTKDKINGLLKTYLAKLYAQKYNSSARIKKIYVETEKVVPPLKSKNQESKLFGGNLWNLKNKTTKFYNKFLSLFTVVQFENSQCEASTSSGQYSGTCYHQTECTAMNGTALGNCADGYGVCCVYINTCGGSSSQNCTYFESPGYPNYDPPGGNVIPPSSSTLPPPPANPSPTPDPRLKFHYRHQKTRWTRQATSTSMSCFFSVYRINSNVQQMRIDFLDLELAGPTNGVCVNERLVISGQNMNNPVPVICGYNTGQHVYVDVSSLSGPLQLSVLSATGARKRYRLRICQIGTNSCTNSKNCLQYYTGITGTISSFNYDQASMANRSQPGYFNNLNYAICIRKEAGYCSITYSNVRAGLEYPFQLRNVNEMGLNIIPPGQAGAEIFNCPNDYIVVGGIRLCGDKFNDGSMIEDFTMNAPVTDSSAGPIVIPVRTNGAVTGRGFKLFYTQNPCMNM